MQNGQRFRVECNVDGRWFGDEFVFPDRVSALAYKQKMEAGSANQYRIVVTDKPVNLPSEEDEESEEEEDSLLHIDWSQVLDLSSLCPTCMRGKGDGDLDRVYQRCECGETVYGRVFI